MIIIIIDFLGIYMYMYGENCLICQPFNLLIHCEFWPNVLFLVYLFHVLHNLPKKIAPKTLLN